MWLILRVNKNKISSRIKHLNSIYFHILVYFSDKNLIKKKKKSGVLRVQFDSDPNTSLYLAHLNMLILD